MKIFKTVESLREALEELRKAGHSTTLVPTMGFLHEGHLSLVRLAQTANVFVSIFVNPLQFNDRKDFESYPQDLDRDLEMLKREGVSGVLIPESSEIYPEGEVTRVIVPGLSESLEGAFRPGHFDGVTTVVSKLFNIFDPDFAVFGEKDFQQLRIIETLVRDLKYRVKIIRGPLIREASGLALSSRNSKLSPSGRKIASEISKALFLGKDASLQKGGSPEQVKNVVAQHLSKFDELKADYIEVVSDEDLKPVHSFDSASRLLCAVWVEGVRLIDNVALRG